MIHISKGNSKLGDKIANISLVPIQDCANSKFCSKKCYALKSYRMYPNVRKCWGENSEMAWNDRENYFLQIADYLNNKKPRYFRWHVAGDILDQNYLDNMISMAIIFPMTRFLCFTKRFDLDYRTNPKYEWEDTEPGNLSFIFSMWPGMPMPSWPRMYGMKFAWMQDGSEDRHAKGGYRMCPGSCASCKKCWTNEDSMDNVVFHMH